MAQTLQSIIVDKSTRSQNRGIPITSTPTCRATRLRRRLLRKLIPFSPARVHPTSNIPRTVLSEIQNLPNPPKKATEDTSQYSGVTETRHTHTHTRPPRAASPHRHFDRHLPSPAPPPQIPHLSTHPPKGNCGKNTVSAQFRVSPCPPVPYFSSFWVPGVPFFPERRGRLAGNTFVSSVFYGRLGGTVTRCLLSIDSWRPDYLSCVVRFGVGPLRVRSVVLLASGVSPRSSGCLVQSPQSIIDMSPAGG